MTKNEREDQLYDEKFDIEFDIFFKLHTLIDASWDSNTVKMQLQKLLAQWESISFELDELHDQLHPEHQPN